MNMRNYPMRCPRCHIKGHMKIMENVTIGANGVFPGYAHFEVLCLGENCTFTFMYVHLMPGYPLCIRPLRVLPLQGADLCDISESGKLCRLFNYEGLAYVVGELWASVGSTWIGRKDWKAGGPWFALMLRAHHARWARILYKALGEGEFVHPHVVRAYIIPMLGFEEEIDQIWQKVVARCSKIKEEYTLFDRK